MGSGASLIGDVRPLSEKEANFQKLFTGHRDSVKISGFIVPKTVLNICEEIKNFQLEDGDVVVMSFPKSGTTWAQEIIWTMINNRNLDSPLADLSFLIKSPQIETDVFTQTIEKRGKVRPLLDAMSPTVKDPDNTSQFLSILRKMKSPRVLKTHGVPGFLSSTAHTKAKTVYMIRDPRDVCLSFYHHCRLFKYEGYVGTLAQFIEGFMEGANWLGPYWKHVEEAWRMRDHPNFYICFYDKLKENPEEEYQKLAKFLEIDICENDIKKIVEHTSFAEMKKRDNFFVPKSEYDVYMNEKIRTDDGGFFRKGERGQWRDVFDEEQKEKFSDWIRKNCPDRKILREMKIAP